MSKILYLFAISIIFQSCTSHKQPANIILSTNSGFDLETINFRENIPALYSKHILIGDGGSDYDSVQDGKLTDDTLKYKIQNTLIDAFNLKVPQKEFGYLYKSPQLDSVAKFDNVYFKSLNTLTDNTKKPIAYYAETQYDTLTIRNKLVEQIKTKLGKPTYAYNISNDYHQLSYEWVLSDPTIQIETSFGWRMTVSSDKPNKNGKYYKLSILIINNQEKNKLSNAHVYEFADKVLAHGEYYSIKDLQFDKKTVFKDDFYLNSWNEQIIKNENGRYNINSAEAED